MSISRVTTWSAGQVLTAAALNAEFSNIIDNPIALWSPAASSADFNGFEVVLDADGDSSITADTDDQIDFRVGAEDVLSIMEDGRYRFTPQALSGTPATSTGAYLNIAASTFTDNNTAGSGTATAWAAHAIQRPTLAATNASVTTTDAAALYIANSPAAGTNQTLTNAWALWIDAGDVRFDGYIGGVGARTAGDCQLVRTNSTTMTLNRFGGHHLFINGKIVAIPASGPTLSNTGLVASTLYYIYAYMSSGTLTLEASTTAYATDSTYGHRIKSGDATRTLVGLARTEGSTPGQFVDSITQRFTRTYFNDPGIEVLNHITTDRSTTSSTYAEANSEVRCEFVSWTGEVIHANVSGFMNGNSGSNATGVSIGFDGVTAEDTVAKSSATTQIPACADIFKSSLAEGYHYATILIKSYDNTNTSTIAVTADSAGNRSTLRVMARR